MAESSHETDERRMLIAGEWVVTDEMIEVQNSYTGDVIATVPSATTDDVDAAIDAATEAFQRTSLSAYERYELLTDVARKLDAESDLMAELITREQGKPITEAQGEVDRAVQTLRLSAEEAKRLFGESVPMDGQKGYVRSHAFTQKEPLGVVAAITPFNFPLNLMIHKAAPALAAGNAVVGKPASTTPLSALKLFEYFEAARQAVDAPAGLVNIVTGSGRTVGDAILDHEAVEAISFTGSTAVGKQLTQNSHLRELTLELGGNDPTIVWHDTDVAAAAAEIIGGACTNAGQVCNSVERVIVHEDIEAELIDHLVVEAESLIVGDPFDEMTDIAAVVDDEQFTSIVDCLKESVEMGATVECGGEYENRVIQPTVLSEVTPGMPAVSDETFGPLVPVLAVSDFDEAIAEANNTEYGLEAGLFTQDLDRAKRAADAIDAGAVNINHVSGFRTDHMPYGGFKDSGIGKEGVKYAVDHFTRDKLVGFHDGFN